MMRNVYSLIVMADYSGMIAAVVGCCAVAYVVGAVAFVMVLS